MNKSQGIKGYLAVSDADKAANSQHLMITQAFKGEVFDKKVRFPKELGTEHPFDFKSVEDVFKRVGVVNGAINKITDAIVGDFIIKAKDANVKELVESFIRDTDFATVLREWIKEGLTKGNGFMELDLKNNKIRVLNANQMYVLRNKQGQVKGYNQWIGDIKRFSINSKKLQPFAPEEIAHLRINKIAGEAYGIGVVWSNEQAINNMVLNSEDKQKLYARKAGAPIHVKVGQPGEKVKKEDIDEFKNNLTYMNNKTEWVTDGNVEMSVLDFGEVGKNLSNAEDADMIKLAFGMEIPIVLWGAGNIPEGLAKVQLEAFQRKIKATQNEIESILEEQIFKPFLLANKLEENVEFIWNLPGEDEINQRLEKLKGILSVMTVSGGMKAAIELEIARLLDLQDLDNVLMTPEEGQKKQEEDEKLEKENKEREEEETKIKQPEVPGAKPNANEKMPGIQVKKHIHSKGVCGLTESESAGMTIKEFVNLKELAGFNYSDYMIRILKRLRIDKFVDLAAVSDKDLAEGLLSKREIQKLRLILKDGFRENKTIRAIEGDIRNSINLKNRIKNGKIVSAVTTRPIKIARTETVRLANMGLVDTYKDNQIKRVRFLAALSDRTCPICESLNAQVFDIEELEVGLNQPPIHTMCRCSLISITE